MERETISGEWSVERGPRSPAFPAIPLINGAEKKGKGIMEEVYSYDGEEVGEAFTEWLSHNLEYEPTAPGEYKKMRWAFLGGMNLVASLMDDDK